MIAVLREINRPRYPTVPMRMLSREAVIQTWDNKIMRLNENTVGLKGSATAVKRIFSPDRAMGQILGGDEVTNPDDAARLLIDKLVSKNLLSLQ
jgi:electron transfer flavoprotein beta subunit